MKRIIFLLTAVTLLIGLSASAFAIVEPFISIREEQLLYTGESATLVAKVTSVKGKYTCTWSVDNEGIIRIVPDGKNVHVRALRPGSAVLTLVVKDEYASYERKCQLNVQTAVKSVEVSGISELTVGQWAQLAAKVLPEDADVTGITWKSSNSAIARVDSEGRVEALAKGRVKITAVALNKVESEPHIIDVLPGAYTGKTVPVELSEDGLPIAPRSIMPYQTPIVPLYAGTTLQLTLENLDHIYDPTWKTTVFGTNDASIATVTNDGLVTAYAPGTVKIYVYNNKTSELIKVWQLTVYDKGKLTLNKASASVKVGADYQLKAYVNGISSVANWKTSDVAVASVNESGVVTGVSKGSATITAYIGTEMAASCKVRVK